MLASLYVYMHVGCLWVMPYCSVCSEPLHQQQHAEKKHDKCSMSEAVVQRQLNPWLAGIRNTSADMAETGETRSDCEWMLECSMCEPGCRH